jgi:YegS/Rv2252/BmrU family lipid kinase
MTDRALILANPRARLAAARDWRPVALAAIATRYATELVEPRSAGETTELARTAARDGVAVVAAAGGDGTINAVAQGLVGTHTALGILPLGSANDLAREYSVPESIDAAAQRIAEGGTRAVDLIGIGDRVFCGVGGLALVARAALAVTRFKQRSPLRRRIADVLGGTVYRISATAALLAPWTIDDRLRITYRAVDSGESRTLELSASALFVTNHRTLGGGLALPVNADPADGVLEICYVPARTRPSLMLNFARLSAGVAIPPGVLVTVRATEATIETRRDDAFVADGELLREGKRFEVRVLPRALRIIV